MPIRRAKMATHALMALLYRTPFWSEVWSGSAAILWSLIAILGADVTARPWFSTLNELAPHWVWEASGLVLGAAQLAAVSVNRIVLRWTSAAVMSAWWMLLTLSIQQYDPGAPSWGVYLAYSVSNLVSMARLVRRA